MSRSITPTRFNNTDSLRAKRGIAFRRLEELVKEAVAARSDDNLRDKFLICYERLDWVYKEFDRFHTGLIGALSNIDPDSIEIEDTVRAQVDAMHYTIKSVYRDLFGNVNEIPRVAEAKSTNVKLPKINLPSFDGDVKFWSSYIDLYNSLIHNNSNLSQIEKFQYLITSLSKEPAALLKSIPVIGDNYLLAYSSLVGRYQNKRRLATNYWQAIVNLAQIKVVSAKGLRCLIDTFTENVAALQMLGFPTVHWDFILFSMLVEKLDFSLRARFERLHNESDEIPTFNELKSFIAQEANALEMINCKSKFAKLDVGEKSENRFRPIKPIQSSYMARPEDNSTSCVICDANHKIYVCPKFRELSAHERFLLVKQHRLCVNCLGKNHFTKSCTSKSSCSTCKEKHNSLLHFQSKPFVSNSKTLSAEPVVQNSENLVASCTSAVQSVGCVLLSTALIEVADSQENFIVVRALLDSGSQANFISEKCLARLKLPKRSSSLRIQCLGQSSSIVKGVVNISIRSRCSAFRQDIETYVLPKICTDTPSSSFNPDQWGHLANLKLADDNFYQSGPIDLLLGADVFCSVVQEGRMVSNSVAPVALNTALGWIVMGKTGRVDTSRQVNSFNVACEISSSLDDEIKQFWELEEVPSKVVLSPADVEAENLFKQTHSRLGNGRFVVQLPFKDSCEPSFVGTRAIALRRFYSLERRLTKNSSLYTLYKDFMRDYLNSSHMSRVDSIVDDYGKYFYIPHHCVLRPDSLTSKIRVVFDASSKDSRQLSLNDTLLTGPKLQSDIIHILLKFRLHQVALTGDIKQMYRQILVDPAQHNYQRIVWRFSPEEPIQDYILNTVTYGTSCAPFLALRTVQELATQEESNFPVASHTLKNDIYVDDIVSGSDSIQNAINLKQNLLKLCLKGGFVVRKWASNRPELVDSSSGQLVDCVSFNLESPVVVKILGLHWKPSEDVFSYNVNITTSECSKRTLLSELARIFDPLGFISPVTFHLKHLIQHLWFIGVGWDEAPSAEFCNKWYAFRREAPELVKLALPRRILVENSVRTELHGFSDASEAGYAAVIYLRQIDANSVVSTSLICSKSKVAPLKRLSIPRLELCGAQLMSKLLAFVSNTYVTNLHVDETFAWIDSSVALQWIRSSPYRWKTFVSNRVSYIQDKIPSNRWFHVRTSDNPADCACRGSKPSEFLSNSLWWKGPSWLSCNSETWPNSSLNVSDLEDIVLSEERKLVLNIVSESDSLDLLLTRFSSLDKIQRILVYCSRFIHNCKNKKSSNFGVIQPDELEKAMSCLVKYVQGQSFKEEIDALLNDRLLSKPFRKLSPFLDERGVLRVGGRLSHSDLPYPSKYPALLPRSHRFTELLITQFHNRYLHPGLQTLQYLLGQQFWILSPKRAIRTCLSKCIRCYRVQPKPLQPIMGNLPSYRVQQVKPFSRTGLDFAGPFSLKMGKIRNAKILKGYLCLFVCLATKAVHLEVVSDLSSEACLAALRRFVSRRGRCIELYSDCGTNFVGAARELNQLASTASVSEGIAWKFGPPSAPHFGGVWEAGVKAVKTHLLRVIGEQVLTYEELLTVFTQIEAILNSRPISPISSDPNDLNALTPGHFLTLEPLTALPDRDLTSVPINRLKRWQLIQRLQQDFWARWHLEYLHTLQQKHKWNVDSARSKLGKGTLVLIKNDLLPPLKWSLARIVDTHPGSDGVVRVATVRTANGTFKRPLVKLCPLPFDQH